jgi:hypothetical protein
VERKLWRRSILTLDEERIYTVDLGDSSSGRNKYTNDYGVTTFRVLAVGSPIRIISAIHIFTSGYKTERPSSRNPSRRSHRAPLPAALHRGRCRVVPPPSLSVAARRKQQATAFLSLMEVSGQSRSGEGRLPWVRGRVDVAYHELSGDGAYFFPFLFSGDCTCYIQSHFLICEC